MKRATKNIAVILFNLGGPDSREAIKPFLFNFFMDKNIVGAPLPVRWLLAKYISCKRSRCEAGNSYAELGYKSPLLENTQKQARALENKLNKSKCGKYKTYICMNYWHPMADEVAENIKKDQPDHIVLLPLYPQYSSTTTGSSFQSWKKAKNKIDLDISESTICCYPTDTGFVKASAKNILAKYKQAQRKSGKVPRILFSAHGLPEKIIKAGDPYQDQCESSVKAIVKELGIDNLDWRECYQSRMGRLKWIGPDITETLEQAGKDGVPVVIYPHAFVSEHLETLVEIEIESRKLAAKAGVPYFVRVPTVSEKKDFIEGLANLVIAAQGNEGEINRNGSMDCRTL